MKPAAWYCPIARLVCPERICSYSGQYHSDVLRPFWVLLLMMGGQA